MPDHVHICIRFPPEYVVVRRFGGRQGNFTGEHLWYRGYRTRHVVLIPQCRWSWLCFPAWSSRG